MKNKKGFAGFTGFTGLTGLTGFARSGDIPRHRAFSPTPSLSPSPSPSSTRIATYSSSTKSSKSSKSSSKSSKSSTSSTSKMDLDLSDESVFNDFENDSDGYSPEPVRISFHIISALLFTPLLPSYINCSLHPHMRVASIQSCAPRPLGHFVCDIDPNFPHRNLRPRPP